LLISHQTTTLHEIAASLESYCDCCTCSEWSWSWLAFAASPIFFRLLIQFFTTTARTHYISGQVLSSHSIVSSSRTVRPCSPWGGRWIGHRRTTWSTVCFSAPHSQVAEEVVSSICANSSGNLQHRRVKPDPGCSWEGRSKGVAAGVRDKSAEFCGVVRPLRILLVICSGRHTYVVVVVNFILLNPQKRLAWHT